MDVRGEEVEGGFGEGPKGLADTSDVVWDRGGVNVGMSVTAEVDEAMISSEGAEHQFDEVESAMVASIVLLVVAAVEPGVGSIEVEGAVEGEEASPLGHDVGGSTF